MSTWWWNPEASGEILAGEGGGGTNVVVSVATVVALAAVPSPVVTVQPNATPTPSTVALAVDLGDAWSDSITAMTLSGAGNATATPAVVAAVASVPAPNILAGQTVSPATVVAIAAVPAPTLPESSRPYIPQLVVELDRDDLIEFGFILDDPVKSLLDSGNTLDRVTVISWDEDITEWVRSGSTDRGGQRELERTAEAGTGHMVLDNRDGRFTPFNVNSPYYPDILPLRRIRIQAVWDTVTYPVFQGFVESWPITFPGDMDNIVTVQIVDGFELLANDGAKVSGSFPQQQTGERVETVLLAAGFAASEMLIDTGVSTVAAVTLENENVLSHIQSMTHVEQGRFFVDREGLFVFTERSTSSMPDLSTRTWADDGTGMSYRELTPVFDKTLILNDVHLTREGGTEQVVQHLESYHRYNWRPKVETGLPLSDDAQVLDLAQRFIDRYHEPQLRIEGLVDNAMQHRFWDQVLDRDLGDLVKVSETQTDIAQVSAIEGIAHDIGQNTWVVSLRVSPTVVENYARLDDPAFRLDDNFILGR
jgi:hypothetical protein